MSTEPESRPVWRGWERIERGLLVLLALAALLSAALFIRRETTQARVATQYQSRVEPEYVDDWMLALRHSSTLSAGEMGGVQMLIVSDYECPACARFEMIRPLLDSLGVGVHIVHLPLRQHRFARLTAAAARCAEAQGRFAELHSALLARQDSIGLLSLEEFALRAEVSDVRRFQACLEAKETTAFIDSSVASARMLGARATPTVVLHGWRYPQPPVPATLKADVESVRSGRPPRGAADVRRDR